MERLTGLDAGFLYMETPTLHMHTLKIGIIDPSTVPGGYSFALLKDVLRERIHLLPPFRRRIVEVPLGLHHPVWIDDAGFDLDHHVRRVGCPAPGGVRELCELVSDIASRQLDRGRPLWEVWAVEGLEGGHVAFVAKIHHAVADGVAAAALLANVIDPSPAPAAPWRPEEIPLRRTLLVQAVRDLARALVSLPSLVRRTIGVVFAVRERRRSLAIAPPLPFAGPRTPFNGALTPHRTFAMTTLGLDDVKLVRKAFGVTVNDVLLAICAGALRRYLTERGALPDRPLVAGVPVSTSTEGRLWGNRVSNVFTVLRTDISDPVDRLRAIHEVTASAKEMHNVLGAEMLADWVELTPPRPFAWFMRTYSRARLADRHRPPINLVVSNVPGPQEPMQIAGARLVGLYSVGPVLEGIGLNVTVWSYVGSLNVGIIACREHVPDIWCLVDAMQEASAELVKSARG